jgi:hypothetical protein
MSFAKEETHIFAQKQQFLQFLRTFLHNYDYCTSGNVNFGGNIGSVSNFVW